MAFDTILQKKYKLRHKYGFRPPVTGRKTDLAGDEEVPLTFIAGKRSWNAKYRIVRFTFLGRLPAGCDRKTDLAGDDEVPLLISPMNSESNLEPMGKRHCSHSVCVCLNSTHTACFCRPAWH